MGGVVVDLVRDEHAAHVHPGGDGAEDRQQKKFPGVEVVRRRIGVRLHLHLHANRPPRGALGSVSPTTPTSAPASRSRRAQTIPRATTGTVIRHSALSCILANQYTGVSNSNSHPAASRRLVPRSAWRRSAPAFRARIARRGTINKSKS